MKKLLLTVTFIFSIFQAYTQLGLEDIIVEEIPVPEFVISADANLASGSVAYRIFVDLASDWEMQLVGGFSSNTLLIGTSTYFYNTASFGVAFGNQVNKALFPVFPGTEYDSYITVNSATSTDLGILRSEDSDDDGLIEGTALNLVTIGEDFRIPFGSSNFSGNFSTNVGIYNVNGGETGPTEENRVLIGQFTTDGQFSFELNIQIRKEKVGGGFDVENYYARNPGPGKFTFPGLIYPEVPGCTSSTACNFNPDATLDDGSCLEPVEDCYVCNETNDGLIIVDSDGDGICDAEETVIPGCTNPAACNYDPLANEDDGSCLVEIENCQICNETNDALILIDDDGDGVCNANEISGCTSPTACNYNPQATDDDGTCIEPVANCSECLDGQLVIVDYDNDGICNANDDTGCTSPTACNYNPAATTDDGSCLEPVEDCYECQGIQLIIVDSDGDGICDAEEIEGCTSPTACNYDPEALIDDGSCLEPVPNCLDCALGGNELIVVDTDGDGICNADEIPGCTNPLACNYDPDATDFDGSCLVPVENCSECEGDILVIIDEDGDGICDAEEPGLEDIIVEIYYISDENDATDRTGGSLPVGSVTYRLFADMRPEFEYQMVYAVNGHPMKIQTSTEFFNNEDRGEKFGHNISANRLDENTLALDSWLAIGGASDSHLAVLKSEDPDGSILGGEFNDGGSAGIPEGLLANDIPEMGIPLTQADGLVNGLPMDIVYIGFEPDAFDNENFIGGLETSTGIWNVLGGVKGPTETNRVLVGQFTTNGEFSFEINAQIRKPKTGGGFIVENYVAKDPVGNEILFEDLVYSSKPGCTSPTACNYDETATLDNGTCLEPAENCYECEGDTIQIIDSDGDGICDADDIIDFYEYHERESFVNIYPNPANDLLNVQINTSEFIPERIVVRDLAGKIVYYNELKISSLIHIERIEVSGYSEGLYIIELSNEKGEGYHSKVSISK